MSITVPAKPGQSFTINATVYDQTTAVMPGASVSWVSSNPSVATVSNSGLVNCLNTGTTTITATSGSASSDVIVNVSGATPTSIVLAPTQPA